MATAPKGQVIKRYYWRNNQSRRVRRPHLTMDTQALSILTRIPNDDTMCPELWELDGKTTVLQSELTFHDECVCYKGRCFVDDGSMIDYVEILF